MTLGADKIQAAHLVTARQQPTEYDGDVAAVRRPAPAQAVAVPRQRRRPRNLGLQPAVGRACRAAAGATAGACTVAVAAAAACCGTIREGGRRGARRRQDVQVSEDAPAKPAVQQHRAPPPGAGGVPLPLPRPPAARQRLWLPPHPAQGLQAVGPGVRDPPGGACAQGERVLRRERRLVAPAKRLPEGFISGQLTPLPAARSKRQQLRVGRQRVVRLSGWSGKGGTRRTAGALAVELAPQKPLFERVCGGNERQT